MNKQNDPFEDVLTWDNKDMQNLAIFELLFKEKYFDYFAKTRLSGKYVFVITDYFQELKNQSPDLAYKMTRLFRQLFINDHMVALKLNGSNPVELHLMFAFDYAELAPQEKTTYELVPAKLLWKDMNLN